MSAHHARVDHRLLIDTSLDGYLHISESGHIVEVNAAYCRVSRYTREDLIGMHISVLEESAIKPAANAGQGGIKGSQRFEAIHRRKDGSLWIADVSVGYPNEDGGEMFGFFRDISDRMNTEDELREQSEFFRLITENLGGFVAVLDLQGVRIYNSPSYTLLLGNVQTAGTYSFLEIHPDDRKRVEEAFRQVATTGIGRHLEYRFMLPNHDGVRQMESRSGVIRDSLGNIKYVAVVSFDITERKQSDAQVHGMAFNDPLTGLPNRRLMLDRLKQALAACKRSACFNALVFIDLDNFKSVNDLYGHAVGDSLLVEVAGRIKRLMREEDTVARIGGDEFVVILSALNKDRSESTSLTMAIAEKICSALSQPYVLRRSLNGDVGTHIAHCCTASIGVSLFADHEANPDDILHWADLAMYQAKDSGRNAIRFHQIAS